MKNRNGRFSPWNPTISVIFIPMAVEGMYKRQVKMRNENKRTNEKQKM